MPLFKYNITVIIEGETLDDADAKYSSLIMNGMNRCEGIKDITIENTVEIEQLEDWDEK
jgi:hypothetical protein